MTTEASKKAGNAVSGRVHDGRPGSGAGWWWNGSGWQCRRQTPRRPWAWPSHLPAPCPCAPGCASPSSEPELLSALPQPERKPPCLRSRLRALMDGHISHEGVSCYQQQDIRLFFGQSSHQLGVVAHHNHACCQARVCDESHLAPYPRL